MSTDLPPGVELLWGLRDKGRRGGPKPALSLERIVAAAVELADEGGIAALSMARLAEKLGFTTMSLYRYVSSKDELILLILDAAIGEPAYEPAGSWRDQVRLWCGELTRRCYRAHPWALDVAISGLPAGPNQLLWFDRGLAAFASTTFGPQEKASAVLLLATFVRTQAQLVRDIETATADGPGIAWTTVVSRLADPERFPEVAKIVASGIFDDDAAPPGGGEDAFPDDEYAFGLDRILDGLEVLDASRR